MEKCIRVFFFWNNLLHCIDNSFRFVASKVSCYQSLNCNNGRIYCFSHQKAVWRVYQSLALKSGGEVCSILPLKNTHTGGRYPHPKRITFSNKTKDSMNAEVLNQRVLRVPDVLALLQIERTTLYRYVKSGYFTATRRGKFLFFDRMEIESWALGLTESKQNSKAA